MQNVELWTQPNLWRADWIESPCRTKHTGEYKNLTDADWKQTPEPLLAKLRKQQELFFLPSFTHSGIEEWWQLCDVPQNLEKKKLWASLWWRVYQRVFGELCITNMPRESSIKDVWKGNLELKLKNEVNIFGFFSLTVTDSLLHFCRSRRLNMVT